MIHHNVESKHREKTQKRSNVTNSDSVKKQERKTKSSSSIAIGWKRIGELNKKRTGRILK